MKKLGLLLCLFTHVMFGQEGEQTPFKPPAPLIHLLKLLDDCLTEGAAALKLWQSSSLPQELRSTPITFIEVPMIQTENGARRPNPLDAFNAWLQESPKAGSLINN